MSQPAKVQEPSMEEILASIRRIIADDEGAKPAAKAAEPPKSAAPPPPPAAKEPPQPPKPAPTPPKVAAPPPPPPPPPPPVEPMDQDAIDAMMATPEEAAAEPDSDILDLTEAMAAPMPPSPAPGFLTIDGSSDLEFTEPEPESLPAFEPPPTPPPAAPMAAQPELSLLSGAATNAVNSAFHMLSHAVLTQNARTLEDLVGEMLRPMLKAWLDDNLPGLVERLVRAEIERVSRGRN